VGRQFTLGKKERLKSRKTIEQLFNSGQRFNVSPFRIFYHFQQDAAPSGSPLKAGFAASSRIFKTAVHRNRIKRLTREAWRLQKNPLQEKLRDQGRRLDVFLIYTGREMPVYASVVAGMKLILSRLIELSDRKN
jgi:ribonuclease P protein component